MKRKLIFVSFIRLTDKVLRDFYIDYNIKKGAEVEFWDIVSLLRNDYHEMGTLDVDYLRYIETYQEFDELLRLPENKDAVYVMVMVYRNEFTKPYRLLSNYNCKMVYMNWGDQPVTGAPVQRWQRVISRFRYPFNFIKMLVDVTFLTLYKKLNIVKPFEIEFVVGEKLISANLHAKRVVPFNLTDFEYYKRAELSNDRIVDGKYALFLDSNEPYHSDNIGTGKKYPNPEKYFKSVNRFIDLIEKSHKIKVVIAANPKSKYGAEKYENREFYRLLTPELAKNSEYIIVPYASMAISYAILNVKPILFIYNDQLKDIWPEMIEEMQGLASYLNIQIYNADLVTHGSQVIIEPPSFENYDSYKYNYLTSYESENASSAQIFWEEINAL